MITLSATGRTTGDVELKTSGKEICYAGFDLAVKCGYGEKQHTVFLQCVAFDQTAKRLSNVKKGSLIAITGDMDVSEYRRKDGSIGKSVNVRVYDWQFAEGGGRSNKKNETTEGEPIDELYCDGDLPL